MHEHTDSDGVISEVELDELTKLFQDFEGAQTPLAIQPELSKQQFHEKVKLLYAAKVKPAFQSVSFAQFLGFTRLTCRKRMATDEKYLCP